MQGIFEEVQRTPVIKIKEAETRENETQQNVFLKTTMGVYFPEV